MKAVEFNGSLKSFVDICRLVGCKPIENIDNFVQKEGVSEMSITILDTIYTLTLGDILIEQNGKFQIVNGNIPE